MNTPAKFCEHCGGALRATSAFCESCGRPVHASGGGAASQAIPAGGGVVCGTCRKDDQVVAASAYTEASDPEVKGDDSRVSPDVVAMFLAQPEKPEAPSVVLWALAPFIPLVLFFVYWFAPIHRGFKVFLFGFTVMFWGSIFVPPFDKSGMYPIIGMLHLLFYWMALFMGRGAQMTKLQTETVPRYQAMLARWPHLQYCKRCQMIWLDNAPAAPVTVVNSEELLAG